MADSPRGAAGAPGGGVIVTGPLGSVGGHVIERLLARHERAIGIVRPGRDASTLASRGIEVRYADLGKPVTDAALFRGAQRLIHLSGLAQLPNFVEVLEASEVKRGVFVSSAGVYTKLESTGAQAKRVAEARLHQSPIDYTIFRPSMIYGTTRDRNMIRLLRWLRLCPVFPVPGGGKQLQQPVHVDDLADVIFTAFDRPAASRQEYDLGGPDAMPLAEVIRQAGAALGRRAVIVPLPLAPAARAVDLLRRLHVPFPVRREQVMRLAESKAVDNTAAYRDLDFRPRTFDQGIRAEAAMLSGG
jgi:uncharacterized protein YbjT (DUF2867 family)